MKKFLFASLLFLGAGFLFQSCEKEQDLDDDALIEQIATADVIVAVGMNDLPAPILQTLDEMFFHTYAEDLEYAPRFGYRITLGDETRLYFRENGRLLEARRTNTRPNVFGPNGPHGPCFDRLIGFGNQVRPEALPQAIHDYVTENYPDLQIRMARAQGNRILVLLPGPTVLMFDRLGNFIQEVSPLERCQPNCNPVAGPALPEAVRAYIADNYDMATFRGACVRNDRIAVFLITSEGRVVLIFDRQGNFLFSRP